MVEITEDPDIAPSDYPQAVNMPDGWGRLLIWAVPLFVAVVCAYLLYESFINVGPSVEIRFAQSVSVERDKTPLKYLGVEIGRVKGVSLDQDLKTVIVQARLEKFAEDFAKEGAQFWVVTPQVTTQGLEGLETITSGIYIESVPGHGKTQNQFDAASGDPARGIQPGDLELSLVADRIVKLKPGSPILYRGLMIGQVSDIDLNIRNDAVGVKIFVRKKFAGLLNSSSRFWYTSGFDANFSLFSGANVEISSFPTLLNGAVSIATLDRSAAPLRRTSGIPLHDKAEDEWKEQAAGLVPAPEDALAPSAGRNGTSAPVQARYEENYNN